MAPSRFLLASFYFLVSPFFLTSCGGGGSSTPATPNPAPSLSSLSPSSVIAGSPATQVTVSGAGFIAGSSVTVNGTVRPATVASASQLTVTLAPDDMSAAGTATVAVTNPAPGGGSASAPLTVGPPAAPVLSSLSPSALPIGSGSFTATGSNFVRASVVRLNGSNLSTTYVSNSQLTATLPASATAGNMSVDVVTAAPGGGTSGAQSLVVQNPIPTISSISPNAVLTQSGGFTLDIKGSNFVNGALAALDGVTRVTNFVSSTEVTATILASDIMRGRVAKVTVVNPAPNAGQSGPLNLTINNAAPVLSSVTPSSGLSATQANVAVTGQGFLTGAKLLVNGTSITPTTVSSTQIAATIPSSLLQQLGDLSITALNPAPTTVASNAVTYTVTPSGPGVAAMDIPLKGPSQLATPDTALSASPTLRYVSGMDSQTTWALYDTCLRAAAGCSPGIVYHDGRFSFGLRFPTSDGRRFLIDVEQAGTTTFEHDTCISAVGCTPSDLRVSAAQSSESSAQGLSDDGRFVALQNFSNFCGSTQLTLVDTCTAAPAGCQSSSTALPATIAQMSSSGRFILLTNITNSPGFASCSQHIVTLSDTCLTAAPGCAPSSTNVPFEGIFTRDGRYVVRTNDVFDTCAGTPSCTPGTMQTLPALSTDTRVVRATSVSDNLRCIALQASDSANLAPNDTNNVDDVFVKDTCIGATGSCTPAVARISLGSDGAQFAGGSGFGRISADGKAIVYSSPSGLKLVQTTGQGCVGF